MSTTATDVRKSKLAEDLRLSAELNPIGRRAAARDRIMAAMAVTSLAVAAWMLSTAAAGLLMFYRRAHAAPGTLDPRVDGNEFLQPYLDSYVFLGIVACVLVVPSVIALAANAAVLGATGREKKIAMLRLLGVSPGRVTRISLITTGAQALVGLIVGIAVQIVTAPAWTAVEFQYTPIGASEMILPAWGYLAVAVVFVLIVLVSAAWSLRRVNISPLGVARETPDPKLTWKRLLFFLLITVLVWRVTAYATNRGLSNVFFIAIAVAIGALIVGYWVVVPWFVQVASRLVGAVFPGVAIGTAAARNQMRPIKAWQRVSTLSILAFGLGLVAGMQLEYIATVDADLAHVFIFHDIGTGAKIVVAMGFVTAACSTLLTQAAQVFENAKLNRALAKLGAPQRFIGTVAAWEILGPMVAATLVMACGGALLGLAMYTGEVSFEQMLNNSTASALALLGGWAVMALALAGAEVLRRSVTGERVREE